MKNKLNIICLHDKQLNTSAQTLNMELLFICEDLAKGKKNCKEQGKKDNNHGVSGFLRLISVMRFMASSCLPSEERDMLTLPNSRMMDSAVIQK